MQEINTWPGWECVRQLGAGSYGKVFEIKKEEAGVTYRAALKVVSVPGSPSDVDTGYDEGWYADEQSATAYFKNQVAEMTKEFALMANLKGYTNIVSYEDHMIMEREDSFGWDILIRMELLTPLPAYAREHPLTEEKVIQMGCDICSALEVCQKQPQPILHRDIKQANIMVNQTGDFKLGDFGIARTLEGTNSAHSTKGTYDYMAPEVYFGKSYGIQADIYSLGMVLYRQLNNNRNPFLPTEGPINASIQEEARNKRLEGQQVPEPLYGNPWLKSAVLMAIHPDPTCRFQTPLAFRKALERALEYKPTSQVAKTPYVPTGGQSYTPGTSRNMVAGGQSYTPGTARNMAAGGQSYTPGTSRNMPTGGQSYTSGTDQNFGTMPGMMPPKKENKGVKIAIIVLAVIGLLFLLIIVIALFAGNESQEKEPEKNETKKEEVEDTEEESSKKEEEKKEEEVVEETAEEPAEEEAVEELKPEDFLHVTVDYPQFLSVSSVDGYTWSEWSEFLMLCKQLTATDSQVDGDTTYYAFEDGSYGLTIESETDGTVYSLLDGDGTTFIWEWGYDGDKTITQYGEYFTADVGAPTDGGCFAYSAMMGQSLSDFMELYLPGGTTFFGSEDFIEFENGYYYFPGYYDTSYDGELYVYMVDSASGEELEMEICYNGTSPADATIAEVLFYRTVW